MAFDAGAIEATLTLNRNPFTAGLAAAKAQVDQWKRRNSPIEVDVKVNLREAELRALQAKLKRFGSMVARATAEVVVKGRAEFDRLLVDLKWFDRRKFTATIDVNAKRATADVIAFRALLGTLNDQTVNLRTNTRGFGNDAGSAFEGGTSHFKKMAIAVIAGLPVIASAFTATVGAVGALASGLLIAGLGAGALAIVAVPAIKSVWKAANMGQEAVNKLPPALQAAGNAAIGMNKEIEKLKTNTQLMVGVGLANWFKAGAVAVSTLTPLVSSAAVAFGNAGAMAVQFFSSPWWKQFVDFLSKSIGPAVDMLFRSIFALIKIVGNLTRAFWDLGGSQILEMIASGLEKFADYTERIGNNKTFQEFMEAAKRSLPVVGELLGNIIVFIFKLAIGLEPLGTLIIRVLNGIFDAVNSLPPATLAALALGFGAMWAAIALGAGGPIGIAVGVLVFLGVLLADLVTKNDNLKASFNAFVDNLKAKWQPIWDTVVKNFNEKILPAWNELVRVTRDELIPKLQRFGEVIEKEVWPKIQPLVDEITGTLVPAILGFLGALEKIIGFLVDIFGPTVADELGSAITVFQGFFDTVAGALDVFTGIFTGDWTKFTQGIQEITQGFWTIVAGMFGMNLDELKAKMTQWNTDISGIWNSVATTIEGTWDGIWGTLKTAWQDFLDYIQPAWETWKAVVGPIWDGIVAPIRDAWNLIWSAMETEWTKFHDYIVGEWDRWKPWVTAYWEGIKGDTTKSWTETFPILSDAWTVWRDYMQPELDKFKTYSDEHWGGIHTSTTSQWAAIWPVLKQGWTDFRDWYMPELAKFNTYTDQHWGGIKTSTWDQWKAIWPVLKTTFQEFIGWVPGEFDVLKNNCRTGINAVIDELNRLVSAINGFLGSLGVPGIPSIPKLESGGTLDGGSVPGMAAGGRVGGGFQTNGPMAIVGEGNPRYPEYVIPTDPKYRSRAQGLYSSLGPQLMASGGILSIPANLAGGAQAAVDGIINGLTSSAGWKWGEIAVAVARKASSALVAKIQAGINTVMSAIAAAAATVFGGGGGGGGSIPGGGDARAWIIAHESGGNPRAQNPTSSASGLYQFIDGTWRSLGGSTAHAKDASVAEQNAIADRYVAQRYGGWEGARAFWQSHGWYDNGGILPTGTSIATNNTGRPEAILTQAQLSAFTSPSRQSLTIEDVLALLNSRDDGVGGSGDVYNVMLPERASVRELADQLDFKRRVVRMGRYSR